MAETSVFYSTFTYAQTKIFGAEWVASQLAEPEHSGIPSFRAIDELRKFTRARVFQDGSTLITKARSRAAGVFLGEAECDVWVSIDDDCYASADVLERLVDATRATHGLIGAPCLLRDGRAVNFPLGHILLSRVLVREVGARAKVYAIDAVGFGVVAFHRDLIERMASRAPQVTEGEGAPYPGLFFESVSGGRWWGDDHGFCARCKLAGFSVDLLLDAPTWHAGHGMQLSNELELLGSTAGPASPASTGPATPESPTRP